MALSTTIALVFDFDDTLVPDSTTLLLKEHGIDTNVFWGKDAKALIAKGYDPTLAYLKLLLDNTADGKPLAGLNNSKLKAFGAGLDNRFHSGLPQLFDDLRSIAAEYRTISIEFYIVSGGLQALVEGSNIVSKYFTGVYACTLEESGDPPRLSSIKRAINFTEKTRYLFEINKGLSPTQTSRNPYLVNKNIPPSKRRIPFSNMIYVGDGLTDIPCFSMLKKAGGLCFGVFDATDLTKSKRALNEFLQPGRVISMHSPRYGPKEDLGSLLRAAISSKCSRIVVEQHSAESGEIDSE